MPFTCDQQPERCLLSDLSNRSDSYRQPYWMAATFLMFVLANVHGCLVGVHVMWRARKLCRLAVSCLVAITFFVTVDVLPRLTPSWNEVVSWDLIDDMAEIGWATSEARKAAKEIVLGMTLIANLFVSLGSFLLFFSLTTLPIQLSLDYPVSERRIVANARTMTKAAHEYRYVLLSASAIMAVGTVYLDAWLTWLSGVEPGEKVLSAVTTGTVSYIATISAATLATAFIPTWSRLIRLNRSNFDRYTGDLTPKWVTDNESVFSRSTIIPIAAPYAPAVAIVVAALVRGGP